MLRETGLTRERSRRLLATGIAGRPIVAARSHLYDASRIHDLVSRATVEHSEVLSACPDGVFVARRDLDATAEPDQQLQALQEGWEFSLPTALWLMVLIDHQGTFPLVATVCGYVVIGAEIEDIRIRRLRPEPRADLVLREAGEWFETFSGHRLPTGRGRPWSILGWNQYGPDRGWKTRQPW